MSHHDHLRGIGGTIALILLCTLLPFMPDEYDPVAVLLSMIAQTMGVVSLLLIPVGLFWLISGPRPRDSVAGAC